MPSSSASLGWDLEGVKNIGNLPIAESLVPKVTHLGDSVLFAFVNYLLTVHDPLPIGQAKARSFANVTS